MTTSERLARIEERLEHLTKIIEKHHRDSEETTRRVRDVEKKINYAAGAVAAITMIITVAFSYIKERLFS